jgi:ribonucleotide reductase alpha subunit
MPEHLKKLGLKVRQSNLCSEILLPTSEERTAVCCLSSLNLERYDEWKDEPLFLRDVAEMLDNVLNYFIQNAPDEVSRAKFSAMRERSIGIGALGFHAYLQQHNLAFESALAKSANLRMFKHIRGGLDEANAQLASERGEAPDAEGTGKRFSHLMAIAPNACVVGDTKITMADGSTLSIEDLGTKLGVDVRSFEYLDVDMDDGTTMEIHIGQEILIKRDEKNVRIIASELREDDEVLEILD